MTTRGLDQLGHLQRAAMEAIWTLGEATVRQVWKRIAGRPLLAYTTVLTVMQKLEQNGWLHHRAEGKAYVYMPTRTRQEAKTRSLRAFIDRVFHGEPLVLFQHLIHDPELSAEDAATIRRILDDSREGPRDVRSS